MAANPLGERPAAGSEVLALGAQRRQLRLRPEDHELAELHARLAELAAQLVERLAYGGRLGDRVSGMLGRDGVDSVTPVWHLGRRVRSKSRRSGRSLAYGAVYKAPDVQSFPNDFVTASSCGGTVRVLRGRPAGRPPRTRARRPA